MKFIKVTQHNVEKHGVFCIKDRKAKGYRDKLEWYKRKFNEGIELIIAENKEGKQIGFIEFIPSEKAWRPILAPGYLFIQCIVVFSKSDRNKQLGSNLIGICEQKAQELGKSGICTVSSKGSWMADKSLFMKNGFKIARTKDRFELMYKAFSEQSKIPEFPDWENQLEKLDGWHLIYARQCPWHSKSIADLSTTAKEFNIQLNMKELLTPAEAKLAPSGYGTFSLIKDRQLLADHYISATRFRNIINNNLS